MVKEIYFFKCKPATPQKLHRITEPSYLGEDRQTWGRGVGTTTAKGLVVEFTEIKGNFVLHEQELPLQKRKLYIFSVTSLPVVISESLP